MFNEGSAVTPGQLVSFTSSFILKRNLCPYYLTSSSVAVNYIKAHFPKLRNFRIYFVACCYRESLLGIMALPCQGCRAGQILTDTLLPLQLKLRHLCCQVALSCEHLPEERVSAAQDMGQARCFSWRRGRMGSAPSKHWQAQMRGAAHHHSTDKCVDEE